MRIGFISLDLIQSAIMQELLGPVFGRLQVYDQTSIDDGTLAHSNDHALIIDYSDGSIMENEVILDLIERDEPRCILTERSLYPLSQDERLGWRKKITEEVARLLPDLAGDITTDANHHQTDLWVIGSSSGGPDALAQFFGVLPSLPCCFILAQHISSDNGSASLRRVLSHRQSNWSIEMAYEGAPVRHGAAYIVQRDTEVSVIDERLSIRSSQPANPSPSINATIRAVRRSLGRPFGISIFTGLGDDGAAAIREVKPKTISVYAQSAEECAARSMPEAARQTGCVDQSDTIAGIARRIAQHYLHRQH